VGGGDCAYPPQWFTAPTTSLLKLCRAPLLREVVMGLVDGHGRRRGASRQLLVPRLKQPTIFYTPPPMPPTAPLYLLCPVWLFCVYFLGCFLVECVYDLFCAFVFVDYVCRIRRVSRPCSCPRTRHRVIHARDTKTHTIAALSIRAISKP
jgi:hypothetical protein